jgi:hypothetical protein
MLGHLETVKLTLTAHPMLLNSKGPHGLTMLHHAIKGGVASNPIERHGGLGPAGTVDGNHAAGISKGFKMG